MAQGRSKVQRSTKCSWPIESETGAPPIRKWRARPSLRFMESETVRLPYPVFQGLSRRMLRRQLTAPERYETFTMAAKRSVTVQSPVHLSDFTCGVFLVVVMSADLSNTPSQVFDEENIFITEMGCHPASERPWCNLFRYSKIDFESSSNGLFSLFRLF